MSQEGYTSAYRDLTGVTEPTPVATFRSAGDEMPALTHAGPRFYQAPWSPTVVGMVLDDDTDWGEVAELVTESYRFRAPQKLRHRLDSRGPWAMIGRRVRRKGSKMARLVFGMNQSLDGYVDHTAFAPGPVLFRHFIEEAQAQAGCIYGRRMYDVMRYWDETDPDWDAGEQAFAAAWRKQPKWVVSRSSTSVGPNASLVQGDLESAVREVKAERDGEIEVAGPALARSLADLGLIDEYRIYLHPVALGGGKPYFAGVQQRLRLLTHDRIGEDVIRLTYVPG